MKQLLHSTHLNQLKERLEPPLRPDTTTIAAIKNGHSGQILQCLKKHTQKPHPRVFQLLMERLAQEQ